ncbi:MAG TPA: phospho-sugar mutase, partial [Clostridia bacterium]|nr:phospho-sugar mutase [Clostridia bacterium]
DLAFGTGGLRGRIGAGTNRMNIYTVRKATQGLADAVLSENGAGKGVAIAYDSRNMSPEFAEAAALCLCANQIKTYIFDSLRPTPMLSFAVRELGCMAGIVITASHNPPEYNGYKVYWEDGGQITYPKDEEIIGHVNAVSGFEQMKTMEMDAARASGLYHLIGAEIDDRYMEALKKSVQNPRAIRSQAKNLQIVYSPLHGTGNKPVRRILKELGFERVHIVEEQAGPDGNFPTVKSPNPEDPAASALALRLAQKTHADIVLLTDPDADRLGVAVKDEDGAYVTLSGNMTGMLMCDYLLEQKKQKGPVPKNGAVVTTIVSTKMAQAVADYYHVHLIETLTGFKYIGEQIKFFEQDCRYEYLFGFEESYGYLAGTHARDKDAVEAVMILCEAAAYYKSKGLTLWDQMQLIYKKYGYYKEGLATVTMEGEQGAQRIAAIIEKLRARPPEKIGAYEVGCFKDYRQGTATTFPGKTMKEIDLPNSNVLYFDLSEGAWCCVRPSGTEPKIKIYTGVKGDSLQDANEQLEALTNAITQIVQDDR